MAARSVFGLSSVVAGWALAEVVATRIGTRTGKILVAAPSLIARAAVGALRLPLRFQLLHFRAPKEILRLTNETMAQFVQCSRIPCTSEWLFVLTVATSLVGALVSLVMRKHFEGENCLRDASQQENLKDGPGIFMAADDPRASENSPGAIQ